MLCLGRISASAFIQRVKVDGPLKRVAKLKDITSSIF